MPIVGGPNESAAVGIGSEIFRAPRDGAKFPGAGETRIFGVVRAHAPAPLTGMRRDDPDFERAPAIPEAGYATLETWALEIDPALDVDIGIRVLPGGCEIDLLHLPDANLARLQARMRMRREADQQQGANKKD